MGLGDARNFLEDEASTVLVLAWKNFGSAEGPPFDNVSTVEVLPWLKDPRKGECWDAVHLAWMEPKFERHFERTRIRRRMHDLLEIKLVEYRRRKRQLHITKQLEASQPHHHRQSRYALQILAHPIYRKPASEAGLKVPRRCSTGGLEARQCHGGVGQ